jgi:methanethiol S-methyltransferase
MPGAVWSVTDETWRTVLTAVSLAGWGIVLISTLLINHFNLFGLEQAFRNAAGKPPEHPAFKTPSLYKFVRHPIYLGFIVAFWAAPVMTQGHLLFSALSTGYIFVGIFFEERDLVTFHGDAYRHYQKAVSMIVPMPGKSDELEQAHNKAKAAAQGD